MSLTANRDAQAVITKTAEKGWIFPTPNDELLILDIVVVAYLPNEKDIILNRVHYAVEEIVYPKDKIRINIVYNTPVAIEPLENQMWELAAKHPQLRIIKVENSTSKADNLNYFLSLNTGSDITAIFDCDHYPHPHNPRWAVERFIQGGIRKGKPEIDIVQGRCIVFNGAASFLAGLIAVEFDKIYAVSHPGRAAIWGFGLFCKSSHLFT
jgi:cellulose synthase/poly-beta-1,6-N-acetylglucosamine synthase-like glycosyltransferase